MRSPRRLHRHVLPAVGLLSALTLLVPRIASADACVWNTAGGNTDWTNAANWTSCPTAPGYPDTGDTANVSSGGNQPTLQSGDTITVNALTINAGATVTVAGTLSIQGTSGGGGDLVVSSGGTLIWRSGSLQGPGTTTIAAGGNLSMPQSGATLQRPLVNQGTATMSGNGYPSLGVGGSINNSGTWEIQNDQGVLGSAQTFTNTGTIKRTTSAGEASIQTILNGSGAVQVQSGSLLLNIGGTYSGSFTFTGATVHFNGGTWVLTGAFSGASGGTLWLDSGTQTFNAGATLTNVGLVNLAGSTAAFNTDVTPDNLTISSGILEGSGAVALGTGGTLTWTGGTMRGTGTTTVGSGRNIVLNGVGVALQRSLLNQGTITQSGNGYFSLGAGGAIDNSGTWEIKNDQGTIGASQPVTNSGTIKRTTSAGDATIQNTLNGAGTIQVESGTLTLTGGGTYSGNFVFAGGTMRFNGGTWALTGDFSGSAGGVLLLDSGTQNFNAGATFTNVPLLNIAGSTATFSTGTTVSPANLTHSSGTLGGSDGIALASGGTYTWTGGLTSGTGTTTIGAGRSLLLSGSSVTLQRPLVMQGSATHTSNGAITISSGGSVNNSGVWEIQNDQGIFGFAQNLANSGTIRRTTSPGTATIQPNVSNSGDIKIESGTLALTGTLTQTAGGTHLIGGNLSSTSTAINIQGGVLDGSGDINANVVNSGGQVSPGASPGTFAITGNRNYTQSGGGVLVIDIDGTTPGTDFDQIGITGAANLGGELKVNLGYTPAVGDSFTILSHASRTGTFATLTFPSPGGGLGWDIAYTAKETKLTIAQMLAALLAVDARVAAGTTSDANGVLEPGERVVVEPAWQNAADSTIPFSGTASNLTGPSATGVAYTLNDTAASYGTVNANATTNCFDASGDCYQVQITAPATSQPAARPAVHWDATFDETVTGGRKKTWTLHVGDSFTDVPRSQLFYRRIETLLHTGITAGCTATEYCPDQTVNRGQMAIFIAKALAGGGANVPVTGEVNGQGYNCIAGASGASIFTDVLPTDIYCKHVHYIASKNVTGGCSTTTYCPTGTISRIEMAAFIAKAIVSPLGGPGIPVSYTDPVTNNSYNCGSSIGTHFTDVKYNNTFCKHVHYLWAKGIVTGTTPTTYGPDLPVTRGAMARFLSNAFNLLLYGPVP